MYAVGNYEEFVLTSFHSFVEQMRLRGTVIPKT
jgi:hypothetical protein